MCLVFWLLFSGNLYFGTIPFKTVPYITRCRHCNAEKMTIFPPFRLHVTSINALVVSLLPPPFPCNYTTLPEHTYWPCGHSLTPATPLRFCLHKSWPIIYHIIHSYNFFKTKMRTLYDTYNLFEVRNSILPSHLTFPCH